MTVEVKICGLTGEAALEAALEAGADYVGLVFYPPSPRHLTLEEGAKLAAIARGRAHVVALVVDPDDRLIAEIRSAVAPDYLQLHGNESPERAAEIARLSGARIIKAIKVASHGDVAEGDRYRGAAARLLYDAKLERDAPGLLPGGNGIAFDWRILRAAAIAEGFILSGGLNSDNVAAAIALTGAPAVDVSSGVESAPGIKDVARIRSFIRAAKAAPRATAAKDKDEARDHA